MSPPSSASGATGSRSRVSMGLPRYRRRGAVPGVRHENAQRWHTVAVRPTRAAEANKDRCEVTLVDADRVAAARERIPSSAETDRLAEWFGVLGDATRSRILYAVLEAGELCVCDLAATVGASETTVSH